jgi:hypothetical protein
MTLNQIINKIKTQAESHKMVGKFAVGAEFDFAVEEVKYYPLVWLVPNGFTFQHRCSFGILPICDVRNG